MDVIAAMRRLHLVIAPSGTFRHGVSQSCRLARS
jgi:hypothetical protein